MDQVLQQLGIEYIFSTPYHPQSNGKLEDFHKYLKPTLKKLCEKDPAFFLVYGRDPNLPLHQIPEPMQWFLGDLESGLLNLEAHHLALAITKETLHENHFITTQKTSDREPPSFKIGDRVYF